MPNGKNLKATAPGASTSTRSSAKVSKSPKHYYQVTLRAVGTWASDYKSGLYLTKLYRASTKEEAVGMACSHVKAKFPRHSILTDEINCETFNPAVL